MNDLQRDRIPENIDKINDIISRDVYSSENLNTISDLLDCCLKNLENF